jgi:hypothetical protein
MQNQTKREDFLVFSKGIGNERDYGKQPSRSYEVWTVIKI